MENVRDRLDTIERKNKILEGYSPRRSKRAALNFVGNILGDVFGLMDSRFEDQYINNLHRISTNENEVIRLLRNQTSIMDATMNVIKSNEAQLNGQNKYIQSMMGLIETRTNEEDSFQYFVLLSMRIGEFMTHYESRENAIIDIILDAGHNHANADLISPQQMEIQAGIIRANIDGRKFFVPEDTHGLFRLMCMNAMIGQKMLIFSISIPIININKYKIFKIIPVPIDDSHGYTWI